MLYQSTRSSCCETDVRAVLRGIAPDGGLYVDAKLAERSFDWQSCIKKPALDMAEMILRFLLPGYSNMDRLVKKAYEGKFESDKLTPLEKVGNDYILELFHGPTAAFKDVALSMLPQLMSASREAENAVGETVILTATSGDTGKAALEGFHDVDGTKIIVFYPADGVSAVQKAQMVTQRGKNVKVCAVKGNFDDCQRGVKEAFAKLGSDPALINSGKALSSANSINIGRLAPQLVYYFIAYSELIKSGRIKIGDKVDFSVPTGNFGDILAGYYAKLLGLPVGKLICASNTNCVLADFINTGVYDRRRKFIRTSSPSMDILVSSNLERLLFYISGGNTEYVSELMKKLNSEGVYSVSPAELQKIQNIFYADSCSEQQAEKCIEKLWRENKYLCDTHTANACYAAWNYKDKIHSENPMVILSTASPYKFPAAVLKALGEDFSGSEFDKIEKLHLLTKVPVPAGLTGLSRREVLHKDVIERDEICDYVLSYLGIG